MEPTDKKTYEKVVALIKSRVQRWPSAYASGMVVREYKRIMSEKGKVAYKEKASASTPPLTRWFKEKWVDIKTGKECGKVKSKDYYPTCRPSIRVTKQTPKTASELTAKQTKDRIQVKQKAKKKTAKY